MAFDAEGRKHSLLPVWLSRALDCLYIAAGWLAGLFVVAIFVIMIGMSAGRLVGFDFKSGDDFASWAMAATAFLGLAYTFRCGEIIRVELLLDRAPPRLRRTLNILGLVVGIIAIGYFAWYAVDMTYTSYAFNDVSQGVVVVPLWIPQLGFSGGLVIFLIALVDEFLNVIGGGRPRYEKPEPQSAEEVIERAMQSGA